MQILNKRCIKKLAKYRKIGFRKKKEILCLMLQQLSPTEKTLK